MDPSADALSTLGTAFGISEGHANANGSLNRNATQPSRLLIPGAFVDVPSDALDYDSRTITPPKQLRTLNSDFPPTPPTMTSSEVAELVPAEQRLSPSPVFVDRVRKELERHRSGLSTPVNSSNSPPTPDPSPPNKRDPDEPRPQRPSLSQHYASSYAESFQTATEGRTPHTSSSTINLLPADMDETPRQSWIERGRAMGLSNTVLAVQEEERAHTDSDSEMVCRVKSYHLESDGSDAERDDKTVTYSASDERSTSDSTPASPRSRKVIRQRQAVVVPRLRRPFQPGDEIKRPDDYPLYGSVGSVQQRNKPAPMPTTSPARQMDSEVMRNVEPVFQPTAPEVPETGKDILQRLEDGTKQDWPESAPLTALPAIPPEEQSQIITPAEDKVRPLEEFAPTVSSQDMPRPLFTSLKEKSLDDNNVVYKMIQDENAKRHSAISDGIVPARVVVPAENKPKLRHTPKRDSLRGDVSCISSSDSTHMLKHKKAVGRLGHGEASSPESDRHIMRNVAAARPWTVGLAGETAHPSFTRGRDKRFSYTAMRDDAPRVAPASTLGNPHQLKRSLRLHSLEHTLRSVSDSARPRSMATTGFAAFSDDSAPSPRLRRSSAEHRLERNSGVRRTTLAHVPESKAFDADSRPQLVHGQLLQVSLAEEHERSPRQPMSDRTPRRDRRESPDASSKNAHSPSRKSLDYRSLHPTVTPMSQMSGTAASEAELCEAKGIPFFPHNNKSLLLVQTARQVSIPDHMLIEDHDCDLMGNPVPGIRRAKFKAFVTPADEIGKPLHSVESPLTNPREAPEPPVIKFIPPTPNDELERQLGVGASAEVPEAHHSTTENPRAHLQRSLSLKDRLRRFSELRNQSGPFGRQNSYRKSAPSRRTPQAEGQRPLHLSSFWQPRGFWADYESEADDDDDDESDAACDLLPAGGDTSDVVEEQEQQQQQKKKKDVFAFPRAMSKRMPGFRGSGGFLMGNSLGIDRHGSNSRRHYVERRVLASHASSHAASSPSVSHRRSEDVLLQRRADRHRRRTMFTVPFSGGRRLEYVGLAAFGTRMQAARKRRQDLRAELRRDQLRESIGTRVYHDGPATVTGAAAGRSDA